MTSPSAFAEVAGSLRSARRAPLRDSWRASRLALRPGALRRGALVSAAGPDGPPTVAHGRRDRTILALPPVRRRPFGDPVSPGRPASRGRPHTAHGDFTGSGYRRLRKASPRRIGTY